MQKTAVREVGWFQLTGSGLAGEGGVQKMHEHNPVVVSFCCILCFLQPLVWFPNCLWYFRCFKNVGEVKKRKVCCSHETVCLFRHVYSLILRWRSMCANVCKVAVFFSWKAKINRPRKRVVPYQSREHLVYLGGKYSIQRAGSWSKTPILFCLLAVWTWITFVWNNGLPGWVNIFFSYVYLNRFLFISVPCNVWGCGAAWKSCDITHRHRISEWTSWCLLKDAFINWNVVMGCCLSLQRTQQLIVQDCLNSLWPGGTRYQCIIVFITYPHSQTNPLATKSWE